MGKPSFRKTDPVMLDWETAGMDENGESPEFVR